MAGLSDEARELIQTNRKSFKAHTETIHQAWKSFCGDRFLESIFEFEIHKLKGGLIPLLF